MNSTDASKSSPRLPRKGIWNHHTPASGHQSELAERDQQVRNRFARDEFVGADRRYHELLERPDLSLAHDRKGRHHHHQRERERPDRGGHEEPFAVEVGVEPRPLLQLDRGNHGRLAWASRDSGSRADNRSRSAGRSGSRNRARSARCWSWSRPESPAPRDCSGGADLRRIRAGSGAPAPRRRGRSARASW